MPQSIIVHLKAEHSLTEFWISNSQRIKKREVIAQRLIIIITFVHIIIDINL